MGIFSLIWSFVKGKNFIRKTDMDSNIDLVIIEFNALMDELKKEIDANGDGWVNADEIMKAVKGMTKGVYALFRGLVKNG